MPYHPLRVLCLLLSAVFLTSNSAFLYAAESNFWLERQQYRNQTKSKQKDVLLASALRPLQAPSLSSSRFLESSPSKSMSGPLKKLIEVVPQNKSRIDEIYVPKESQEQPVIILQDIHLNPEAQKNIAGVIQRFIDQEKVGVVGVEGAFDKLNFDLFRSISDKETVQSVTKTFLEKKHLAAPSYVGITSKKDLPTFIGIDSPKHYKENVDAYLESIQNKDAVRQIVASVKKETNLKKSQVLKGTLKTFDQLRSKYHQDNVGLGVYIQKLKTLKVSLPHSLEQFLEAYEIESKLDFKRVSKQRERIVYRLAEKLDEKEMSSLLRLGVSYRMGQISHAVYYGSLRALLIQKSISLEGSNSFDQYIRYVLLSDKINAKDLFADLKKAEKDILQNLTTTEEEKTLLELSEYIQLVEKLVDFSLTPFEWDQYETMRGKIVVDLSSYERFYIEARIRSEKMIENLLKQPSEKSRLIVTGGFHSPDLTQILKQQKKPYLLLTPKITKIENEKGSSYLSVFSREKTPLDQLFAGKELFINALDQNVSDAPKAKWLLTEIALKIGERLKIGQTIQIAKGFLVNRLKNGLIRFRSKSFVVYGATDQENHRGYNFVGPRLMGGTILSEKKETSLLQAVSTLDPWLTEFRSKIKNPILLFLFDLFYVVYTVFLVNWEIVYQIPFVNVLVSRENSHSLMDMALPLALFVSLAFSLKTEALVLIFLTSLRAGYIFAQAHSFEGDEEALFLLGIVLSLILFLPSYFMGLSFQNLVLGGLLNMGGHSLYNLRALILRAFGHKVRVASVLEGDKKYEFTFRNATVMLAKTKLIVDIDKEGKFTVQNGKDIKILYEIPFEKVQQFALEGKRITIGRKPKIRGSRDQADIVLSADGISKFHAGFEFEFVDNKLSVFIVDTNSNNGTMVLKKKENSTGREKVFKKIEEEERVELFSSVRTVVQQSDDKTILDQKEKRVDRKKISFKKIAPVAVKVLLAIGFGVFWFYYSSSFVSIFTLIVGGFLFGFYWTIETRMNQTAAKLESFKDFTLFVALPFMEVAFFYDFLLISQNFLPVELKIVISMIAFVLFHFSVRMAKNLWTGKKMSFYDEIEKSTAHAYLFLIFLLPYIPVFGINLDLAFVISFSAQTFYDLTVNSLRRSGFESNFLPLASVFSPLFTSGSPLSLTFAPGDNKLEFKKKEKSILLGNTVLIMKIEENGAFMISVPQLKLEKEFGLETVLTLANSNRPLKVGRDLDNDFVLNLGNISREHLEIHFSLQKGVLTVSVKDLDSSNGVNVNNQEGNIPPGVKAEVFRAAYESVSDPSGPENDVRIEFQEQEKDFYIGKNKLRISVNKSGVLSLENRTKEKLNLVQGIYMVSVVKFLVGFGETSLRLGRNRDSDIHVKIPGVLGYHAEIIIVPSFDSFSIYIRQASQFAKIDVDGKRVGHQKRKLLLSQLMPEAFKMEPVLNEESDFVDLLSDDPVRFEIGEVYDIETGSHKINGGKSKGRSQVNRREILVVDMEEDTILREFYEKIKKEFLVGSDKINGEEKGKLIEHVYSTILTNVEYSKELADKLAEEFKDQEVLLGPATIAKGKGVCRHHGLIVAVVLEGFIKEGILGGRVFLGSGPAHRWAVYQNSTGDFFVLDVSQENFGPIENMMFYGQGGYYPYDEQLSETILNMPPRGGSDLPDVDKTVWPDEEQRKMINEERKKNGRAGHLLISKENILSLSHSVLLMSALFVIFLQSYLLGGVIVVLSFVTFWAYLLNFRYINMVDQQKLLNDFTILVTVPLLETLFFRGYALAKVMTLGVPFIQATLSYAFVFAIFHLVFYLVLKFISKQNPGDFTPLKRFGSHFVLFILFSVPYIPGFIDHNGIAFVISFMIQIIYDAIVKSAKEKGMESDFFPLASLAGQSEKKDYRTETAIAIVDTLEFLAKNQQAKALNRIQNEQPLFIETIRPRSTVSGAPSPNIADLHEDEAFKQILLDELLKRDFLTQRLFSKETEFKSLLSQAGFSTAFIDFAVRRLRLAQMLGLTRKKIGFPSIRLNRLKKLAT